MEWIPSIFSALFSLFFLSTLLLVAFKLFRVFKIQKEVRALALQKNWEYYFSLRGYYLRGKESNFSWEFGTWLRQSAVRRRYHLQDWHSVDIRSQKFRLALLPPLSQENKWPSSLTVKVIESFYGPIQILNRGEENLFRIHCQDTNMARELITDEFISCYQQWLIAHPIDRSDQCFLFIVLSPTGLEIAYPERFIKMESFEAYLRFCSRLAKELNRKITSSIF
ncbi:MAG: hypothetical protein JNK65_02100 [Deltaproteobacteria bacterium]|nr:hypothetical protein [Deltaproteobacteria bacterium]